ncbi:hypothetical protein [Prosthecobacter sp.]|uniref:putative polyvalent protein kinase domain-containing protein n=1 Tax=Prosthecobacter sp. TaxID=1965333 RepID=UPI0037841FF9
MQSSHAAGDETNQNAHVLRRASPDLLRRAAAAVAAARPDHERDDPAAAGQSEIRALADFGHSEELMLDGSQVRKLLAQKPLKRGLEHEVGVMSGEKLVIKDYDPRLIDVDTWDIFYKPTDSLFDYLTDLMLCNHLFGDDLRLRGFYEENNQLHVIITQPYVDGTHPDWSTLVEKLEAQGLLQQEEGSAQGRFWVNAGPAGRILMTDAHEDNVIISTKTGRAELIDVHFSFGSREARIRALQALGLF